LTWNSLSGLATLAGAYPPGAEVTLAEPVAAPGENFPVAGVSATLHDEGVLVQVAAGMLACAWMIVVNLPVVFWVWLSVTLSGEYACPGQLSVPVTVATPVFAFTATFGEIVRLMLR
jgi:hypothetical protein